MMSFIRLIIALIIAGATVSGMKHIGLMGDDLAAGCFVILYVHLMYMSLNLQDIKEKLETS